MNVINSIYQIFNKFEYGIVANKEKYTLLLSHLQDIKDTINTVRDNEEEVIINFPSLPKPLEEIKAELGELLSINSFNDLKLLLEFTEQSGEISYIKEKGGAFIYFKQLLPEEIDKIVVLDASHTLRELTNCDPTIITVPLGVSKSYSSLSFKYFKSIAGRNSLEKEFFDWKSKGSRLVEEIIHIIISILKNSPNEGISIWSYKQRGKKSIFYEINKRLEIELGEEEIERLIKNRTLNFSTFGNELGLNSLSHCKHSVFCGLIYLPSEFVACMIKGQSRNMNRKVYQEGLLENAVLSEQAHSFYQAVSRGSSRLTNNGECLEHTVYFFHPRPEALKERLESVFPDAQWSRYEAVYLDNSLGLYSEISNSIQESLDSLSSEEIKGMGYRNERDDMVSTRSFKRKYFDHISVNQWREAIKVWKEDYGLGWELQSRSFVKVL